MVVVICPCINELDRQFMHGGYSLFCIELSLTGALYLLPSRVMKIAARSSIILRQQSSLVNTHEYFIEKSSITKIIIHKFTNCP